MCARPGEDDSIHHPTRRRLLEVLMTAKEEPTKSALAEAVYGRSDSSTRAMTTRLTAALMEAGLLDERLQGRERRVRLTPRGREEVSRWADGGQRRDSWIDARKALGPAMLAYPADRPRFHLRHAALLALSSLYARASGPLDDADAHYEQVLLALINEHSPPGEDAARFYRLARSWPISDRRVLLADCLVRFQEERTRASTLDDLAVVGDTLAPDADAILWATCAINVAHHHLIDPRVPMDRLTARGLLARATSLLEEAGKDRALAVAAAYRFACASKVRSGVWVWTPPPPDVTGPASPLDPLAQEIANADQQVRVSSAINDLLDPFDAALARAIGPRIMRALPDAEPLLRRVPHHGASKELHDWKTRHRDYLPDLFRGWARSDAPLRGQLQRFVDASMQMIHGAGGDRAASSARVLVPHINQCALLLGEDSWFVPEDVTIRDYRGMVLNNLWTPEMVAADVVISNEPTGEPGAS
jgi:DNA-binding transcriptional ArsR family regulator